MPWLMLTVVALIVLGALFFYWSRPRGITSQESPLSLRVSSTQDGLRISWNPNSSEIQGATEGTITITDSTGIKHIRLDAGKLKLGQTTCTAAAGDVYFRMEVSPPGRLVTDSAHVVVLNQPSGEQPAAPPAERPSVFGNVKTPEPGPTGRERKEPPPAQKAGAPKEAEEPKQVRAFSWTPPGETETRPRELPPAPALPSTPPPKVSPHLPSNPKLSQTATAVCEPVAPSGFRRFIGRIPVVNKLQSQAPGGKGFEAARPAQPVTMTLPPDGSGRPGRPRKLEVRARVNESGRVVQVEVPTDNAALIDVAAYASQSWRFTPARLNGKAVASDVILRFDFGNN